MANIARSVAAHGMLRHRVAADCNHCNQCSQRQAVKAVKAVEAKMYDREMMVCTIAASMLCYSPGLESFNSQKRLQSNFTTFEPIIFRPTTWQPDANPNGFLLNAGEAGCRKRGRTMETLKRQDTLRLSQLDRCNSLWMSNLNHYDYDTIRQWTYTIITWLSYSRIFIRWLCTIELCFRWADFVTWPLRLRDADSCILGDSVLVWMLFDMISTEKPHANMEMHQVSQRRHSDVMTLGVMWSQLVTVTSQQGVCEFSQNVERIWLGRLIVWNKTSAGSEVTGDDSAASGANQGWSRNLKLLFFFA